MALRSQAALVAILITTPLIRAAEFVIPVAEKRLGKDRAGELRIGADGLALGAVRWPWTEVRQLRLGDREIRIATYRDRRLRLGADESVTLRILNPAPLAFADQFLRAQLDERYISARAMPLATAWWSAPVKALGLVAGVHGLLEAAEAGLVFTTPRPDHSRSWRWRDIINVYSTSPWELTIATRERDFRFQLKQRLEPDAYDRLWRRVNRDLLPTILNQPQQETTQP